MRGEPRREPSGADAADPGSGGTTRLEGLGLVWDERFREYRFGPGHPFSEESRALAVRLFAALVPRGTGGIHWVDAVEPAPHSLLETFHRREYLAFVEAASAQVGPTLLDSGDTPGYPGCFPAAARIVAGAARGLDLTLDSGRPAFHPAGGLHHAQPDRASGFCIFNDVAIAVGRALEEGHRVAYIDIDAHHGDGVMYGFYDSGRVLDIDFHQDGRTLFPGTGFPAEIGRGDGTGLKVNLPLPPGAGDEALVPLFSRVVPPLLRSFRPDVIVLQHGVDGHAGDALARLEFTLEGYARVDRELRDLAREVAKGRLLVTGGGGYGASNVSRVLAQAALVFSDRPPPAPEEGLPAAWQEEFRTVTATRSPDHWQDRRSSMPSPWSQAREDALIEELEAELGQRFPRSDGRR